MRIDGNWLRDSRTQSVLGLLTDAGHAAYLVGGCVRNALMGHPVSDVDIATDARPERVTGLAEAAGITAVPTGIAHGTVTLVVDGAPFEVTTFRRDEETDGRRAVVAFSDALAEDAARRDFTINALYATAAGDVVDPLDGLPDLRARRIRFVGEAAARVAEDYLRILRFFRFHAWYGDPDAGLDPEALAVCAAGADGLDTLSAERIGAEMVRLLAAPDPAPSLSAMAVSGILARILPGADAAPLTVLVHLEGIAGIAPDAMRRLACLGGDPAPLRLSKKRAARLDTLLRGLAGEQGAAELAWRHGADTARDIELLRAAAFGAPLPADLDARIARGAAARFPLSGADLVDRFDGAEIGERLRAAERRWIASEFRLTRDQLLD